MLTGSGFYNVNEPSTGPGSLTAIEQMSIYDAGCNASGYLIKALPYLPKSSALQFNGTLAIEGLAGGFCFHVFSDKGAGRLLFKGEMVFYRPDWFTRCVCAAVAN